MANKNEESKNKETIMNAFPMRSLVMMLMGIIFGGVTVFGYMYIIDIHLLIPGPSIGRLRYLLIQIPPLWWMWVTSGLFVLIIL
mgnify:FL=1